MTEAFRKFMDQEWPLWRQHSDTGLAHKLQKAFAAGVAAKLTDEELMRLYKERFPPPPNPKSGTVMDDNYFSELERSTMKGRSLGSGHSGGKY